MAVTIRIYQAINVDLATQTVAPEPTPFAIKPCFAGPAMLRIRSVKLASLVFPGFAWVDESKKAGK